MSEELQLDYRSKDVPGLRDLILTAKQRLLEHKGALRLLSKMTFGDDGSGDVSLHEEDIADRIRDIREYLSSYFPIVHIEILRHYYASTPDPTTLPRFQHYTGPWFARSINERKLLKLEFSLNAIITSLLFQGSDNQHIILFLQIAVIHELAHIVMYTFATHPTPTRCHGYRSLGRNVPGIDANGKEVCRGEPGDAIEVEMVGGSVSLALPRDGDIANADLTAVIAVVKGFAGSKFTLIGATTPNLSRVLGNWELINNLPQQPEFPAGFRPVRLKLAAMGASSTTSEIQAASDSPVLYYFPFERCVTPIQFGVKR